MSGTKKQPLPLSRIFLCSALICTAFSFLGPFAWKIYSLEGVVFFYVLEGLFWLGLVCGRFLILRDDSRRTVTSASGFNICGYAALLTMVSLASILACIYLLLRFRSYYGDTYQFGEAAYEFADEGRGLIDRLCTVFMQFGMASYLLGVVFQCNYRGARKAISILGFWTTAVYYTISGSRFPAVVGLIVFLVANRQQSLDIIHKVGNFIHRKVHKLIVITLILSVVATLGTITNTRMSVDSRLPQNHYEFIPGDSPLKESWVPIATNGNPLNNAIYSMFDYIGEAPFVFAVYFNEYTPDKIYWGESTLRAIGQFLRPLGIDIIQSQGDIYAEIGGGDGKYSGFGYTLIIDFGVYGAPLASFLFGFLFAKVERNRDRSPLLKALYPCVVTSVIFAPIYYFYIGRLDYVLLGAVLLWLLRLPFNRPSAISKVHAGNLLGKDAV